MIKKIYINKVAIYQEKGVTIDELNKINFIYGSNGSGKTTISKYLDNSKSEEFFDCNIEWKNDIELKTYVYNKDFRERNFGKSDIEGIFTLGEATKEQIVEIEEKKKELTNREQEIIAAKKTKSDLNDKILSERNTIKEQVWSIIYKKNEKQFKEAFKGHSTKDKFLAQVLLLFENAELKIIERSDIESRSKMLLGQQPSKLINYSAISAEQLLLIEDAEEWNKKIVGKEDINIGGLIRKLGNGDWVRQGRKYITQSKVCPFCQKETIHEEFKQQLQEFFDEEFEMAVRKVKEYYECYEVCGKELIQKVDALMGRTDKLDDEKLMDLQKIMEGIILTNLTRIKEKVDSPGRTVEIVSSKDVLGEVNKLVGDANDIIAKHNKIVDNYQDEKSNLVSEIWSLLVQENQDLLKEYINKAKGFEKGIENINKKIESLEKKKSELSKEIVLKNKNITSVQPTVDEINRILSNYGFNTFSIIPSPAKEGHYQIQRENGSLAESTLSEGEVTFITFLYFLQWIKGSKSEDEVVEDRVIVIDDPISSLDSSILFVVSSLLKEVLKNIMKDGGIIKQAIILTHNVYFHKEISYFGNGKDPRKEIKYWILRKGNNIANIQCYDRENPISSSYELLWKELKEIKNNSWITVQNVMRRIIENYFKILGKYTDDTLIDKFPDYESREICRALLIWVNDGSHSISDDLYIERPDESIEKYKTVFKQVFEYSNQLSHYNMMMGIDDVS